MAIEKKLRKMWMCIILYLIFINSVHPFNTGQIDPLWILNRCFRLNIVFVIPICRFDWINLKILFNFDWMHNLHRKDPAVRDVNWVLAVCLFTNTFCSASLHSTHIMIVGNLSVEELTPQIHIYIYIHQASMFISIRLRSIVHLYHISKMKQIKWKKRKPWNEFINYHSSKPMI